MDFGLVFALFVIITSIAMWLRVRYQEVERVKSNTDGRVYVVRRLPDSQEAADRLGRVNLECQQLIKHLVAKFPKVDAVRRLHERYNPEAVSEGAPDSGYTSYAVNKGEKIIICIRQKDLSFVDHNILMYVVIHELGHLMTLGVGHTKPFWNNFKHMLTEAVSLRLYQKVDFDHKPEEYCSIEITSSVI